MLGVLGVPALVSFAWFSVFGGSALNGALAGQTAVTEATSADISTALFALLEGLPLGGVLTGIATLLIASFFITSADSATYVLGLQSSGGRKEPSNGVKLTWGVMQSLIACGPAAERRSGRIAVGQRGGGAALQRHHDRHVHQPVPGLEGRVSVLHARETTPPRSRTPTFGWATASVLSTKPRTATGPARADWRRPIRGAKNSSYLRIIRSRRKSALPGGSRCPEAGRW